MGDVAAPSDKVVAVAGAFAMGVELLVKEFAGGRVVAARTVLELGVPVGSWSAGKTAVAVGEEPASVSSKGVHRVTG